MKDSEREALRNLQDLTERLQAEIQALQTGECSFDQEVRDLCEMDFAGLIEAARRYCFEQMTHTVGESGPIVSAALDLWLARATALSAKIFQ